MTIRNNRSHGGRQATDDQRPDPVLKPLTVQQAARLVRLAEAAVARRGIAMRYDGAGSLVPAGDGPTAGLGNLALKVAGLPRQQWHAEVSDHFDQMPMIDQLLTPPDDLENQLYLRLVCAAAHDPGMVQDAPEFVPGLVTAPAVYAGRAVAMYFDVDRLGVSLAEATRIGLANLRRLHDEVETLRLGGAELSILTGGMFTASRALVFDTVLRDSLHVENPPSGCLVALPSRDKMLVHVLRDATALNALGMLAACAAEFFNTSPGAVSPHVYYVIGDQWHQVTDYSTGTFHVHDVAPLIDALERLGAVPTAA
ncbi:hypothetical protein JOF29_003612 [Kribbella aluminosa]|uniref:Uncharacterized protein n=1 Tax=Kribbella aluminosa TaxID=416017 RepID=A0ABS4ULN9_9ACTN|nr:hypothetical protein [Kribbella aluminosa]MBP2352529.1 hypothetical protein [Kribbella aluminosa]